MKSTKNNFKYYYFQTLNTSCVLISFATYFIKSLQNRVISDPKKIKAKRKNQTTTEVINVKFVSFY